MVGKKAQQATEAALTGLDRVAKTIESNHKAWGLNPKTAKTFSSQDALDAYLKEHPGADKSKHKVDSR